MNDFIGTEENKPQQVFFEHYAKKVTNFFRILFIVVARILFSKAPIRYSLVPYLFKRMSFLPYEWRLNMQAVARPYYGYPIFYALKLAKSLGYKKVSIVEFGVAGGNGLVNIEYHVREIQKKIDIDVEVYGFDVGSGLPKPVDYRDLPYQWKEGFYKMDLEKLKSRLKFSKLLIGDVKNTIEEFEGAPVACVMFDLDYYSSTVDSLKIFNKPHLPRVFCYFDDVIGCNEICLYNDFTGELLAINEFNQSNKMKITKLKNTAHFFKDTDFQDNLFVMHDFEHPEYGKYVNFEDGEACNLSS